MLDFHKTFELS